MKRRAERMKIEEDVKGREREEVKKTYTFLRIERGNDVLTG